MDADFKKLYFTLVKEIADTIDAIDLMRAGGKANSPEQIIEMTREGLIKALQRAEEMYIEAGERDE